MGYTKPTLAEVQEKLKLITHVRAGATKDWNSILGHPHIDMRYETTIYLDKIKDTKSSEYSLVIWTRREGWRQFKSDGSVLKHKETLEMSSPILKEGHYEGEDALEVYLKYIKPAGFLNISQKSLENNIITFESFYWDTNSSGETKAYSCCEPSKAVTRDFIRRHFSRARAAEKAIAFGTRYGTTTTLGDTVGKDPDLVIKKLDCDF